LPDEEVRQNFGEDKVVVLTRFKNATQQALTVEDFLKTQELSTLQALVLFLIWIRGSEDPQRFWSLTGLAIRIAQSIGLHRDGKTFSLSPFETEMSWMLGMRTSEDFGSSMTTSAHAFDTKPPLNLNDSDFDESTVELSELRLGCTDTTLTLIRYEFSMTSRSMQDLDPLPSSTPSDLSFIKKELLEEGERRINNTYLQHCDLSDMLSWITTKVARAIIAKM
jgi:hypothetical protein